MAYFFKPSALRDIKRLPKSVQKRILYKLDFFLRSPDPLFYAKVLHDVRYGQYRFRIGDYRVIFDINTKGDIIVLAIGHRKDIYS